MARRTWAATLAPSSSAPGTMPWSSAARPKSRSTCGSRTAQVEIRSAEHLWGTDDGADGRRRSARSWATSACSCAMIGPGGEKLVRFACVMNELKDAAGRTGLGAVMGSKNLKAVAARGHQAARAGRCRRRSKSSRKWMVEHWKEKAWGMHDLGTDGGLEGLSEFGALPTRNFQDGQFEGADKITGDDAARHDPDRPRPLLCLPDPLQARGQGGRRRLQGGPHLWRAGVRDGRRLRLQLRRSTTCAPSPRPTSCATPTAWTRSRRA